jgi:hypothetical protein
MRLLCSKELQICSSQLDMECDSFNEQSGELSFGRIVVPLVLEPSYCSFNDYNQLTTFMFKSRNLTNSASLVLKFLKGPYIYMSSLVCTKYDINITLVESSTPILFNHIGNFILSICYFLNFCSFVCFFSSLLKHFYIVL